MRRDQLEHAIRTACQIIGHPAVIIVGSQAILGSFGEDELPVEVWFPPNRGGFGYAASPAGTAVLVS